MVLGDGRRLEIDERVFKFAYDNKLIPHIGPTPDRGDESVKSYPNILFTNQNEEVVAVCAPMVGDGNVWPDKFPVSS